jgi:hypothetical protein
MLEIADVIAQMQCAASTFFNATQAFNNNNWDQYAQYLDEYAVAYNITTVGIVRGRDNIKQYFRGISDPKDVTALQFELTNDINWFPPPFPLRVWGKALWTHKAHGHIKVPIKYECQFYPGNCLLTMIWAQHSPPGYVLSIHPTL